MMYQGFLKAGIASLTLVATIQTTAAASPQQRPDAQAGGEGGDAIFFHSAGLDRVLVDERDLALRDALRLLSVRLGELPEETQGQVPLPGNAIELIVEMFMSPMTLRAGVIADADPMQGPPFWAQLMVGSQDEAEAKERAETVLNLVREQLGDQVITPLPGDPTIQVIDLEGVPAYIGTSSVADRPVFVAALQRTDMQPSSLSDFGLPQGVRPVLALRMNGQAAQPLLEMMIQQAGPQGEMMRAQFELMGMLGEHPMSMQFAMGHGDDRSHLSGRYENYLNNEMYSLIASRDPLTSREIALIPEDATVAEVVKVRMDRIGDYVRTLLQRMGAQGQEIPDPFEAIREQIGVDPQQDLFRYLGDTAGGYMSDTTGGGGIMSMVVFAEVQDIPRFEESLETIKEKLNTLLADSTEGYVEFRTRTLMDVEMITLTFPGLPVPLEISSALAEGYWFVAATPQALIAAINHTAQGSRSLANNAQFREMNGDNLDKANSVQFVDTPRVLQSGYGMMTMATSALSNAVKSRLGDDREAGLIMPGYAELANNARASAILSWYEGDDLVIGGQMDRSMLVNLTGAAGGFGSMYGGVMAAAVVGGALMPAMERARGAAQQTQAMAQLRNITMAAVTYEAEHGSLPNTMQELVDGGYLQEPMLQSPYGPIGDDAGDFWINADLDSTGDVENPAATILAYDRAMMMSDWQVAVAFVDGHVEMLDTGSLMELMESPDNTDFDFKLPW